MKKRLGTCLILLLTLIVIYSPARFQEGNPIPILLAIIKLEQSDKDYIQFAETETHIRYISKNKRVHRYDVIKEMLQKKGWSFKDQLGSGLVFESGTETLTIETRLYSKLYYLWELPKEIQQDSGGTAHD
ncbi:hypothetical protein [Bacillus sp. Marseille-Q3570]|uniref:hypothetical protein n=1 Tax=Bacillus sp. Marseille-Q3570 TaxID=2963522 RepID=UPI0021B849B5|nr:hypothetical protein [Bacillus sp. Marseille-Q3570]